MQIRKATRADIPRIMELLHQVNMVHHRLRPELFKPHTTKYSDAELAEMMGNEAQPIFVADDGKVCGYAFCQITDVRNDLLLQDRKTLYIDDLCVDEIARGQQIGRQLFEHVRAYAQEVGCDAITLNVWEGNAAAMRFYRNNGMQVQKTCMELIIPKNNKDL